MNRMSCYLVCMQMTTLIAHGNYLATKVPCASIRLMPISFNKISEYSEHMGRVIFGAQYISRTAHLEPWCRDPVQDTQVLYNENMRLLKEIDDTWLYVELDEQFDINKKTGCAHNLVGYIEKKNVTAISEPYISTHIVCKPWAKLSYQNGTAIQVPLGTQLYCISCDAPYSTCILPNGEIASIENSAICKIEHIHQIDPAYLRKNICSLAETLVGGPYCWGGRVPYDSSHMYGNSSFDCSGLINIVYRANGIHIPRNAHGIWMSSKKIISGRTLQHADLIFLAPENNPNLINHVMLYVYHTDIIESCISAGIVKNSAQELFETPLEDIVSGQCILHSLSKKKYIVYLGSYIEDKTERL